MKSYQEPRLLFMVLPSSLDLVHLPPQIAYGPKWQAQTSKRGHFRPASHLGNTHQFQTSRKEIYVVQVSVLQEAIGQHKWDFLVENISSFISYDSRVVRRYRVRYGVWVRI